MSTERWDDERLDRLAAIVENNARNTANHAQLIESNARAILALVNATAEAREERDRIFERIDQMQANIERQQTEIVGLRTETNRLLDLLLNQRNQEDNPSN
jgi:septal ring factor EnvC (AmiA/AmiB activator)